MSAASAEYRLHVYTANIMITRQRRVLFSSPAVTLSPVHYTAGRTAGANPKSEPYIRVHNNIIPPTAAAAIYLHSDRDSTTYHVPGIFGYHRVYRARTQRILWGVTHKTFSSRYRGGIYCIRALRINYARSTRPDTDACAVIIIIIIIIIIVIVIVLVYRTPRNIIHTHARAAIV